MRQKRAGIAAVISCLTLAVTMTACGSDDGDNAANNGSANSPGTSEASAGGRDHVATAKADLEKGYQGTYREPPTSGPPAQKGQNVWVISCSQAVPGCSIPALGVKEAGKALGWKVTIFDGKYNPPSFTTGIKQAIAAKADAIITVAMDCPLIKGGLTAAKAAKIPTVGLYSYDCDNPKYKGSKQFTAEMNYGKPNTPFFEDWGKYHATYAIAKTDGKAKVIVISGPEYVTTVDEENGFRKEFAKCSTCKIVDTVKVLSTDLASGKGAQKVATALAKNPDANAIVFAYDAQVLGTAQALKRVKAQRKDLLVIGGEGFIPNMDLIRSGTETASIALPTEWMGYAGADTANRLIAGETEIPDSGWGLQIIDKEHGLPPAGQNWKPNVDFKAAFKKVWAGQ